VGVFVDWGRVGGGGGDSDTQAGAGFGLRYATGVGPVRLDLAVPLNDDGRKVQIYVGLGQAF
jgi:translocation and assembly module TamA